jgi:hypothetical protein
MHKCFIPKEIHIHVSHSYYNITHALNFLIASCKCGSSMHTLGHAEHEQENTVHKRQVVRRLTFSCLSKSQAPVHNTQSLTFTLINIFILRMIVH